MANIILRTKAILPKTDKDFSKFLNYMDRDSAKENDTSKDEYFNYLDYMDRDSAKDENRTYINLFTNNKEFLTLKEKKEVRETFKKAQEKNSIMWQTVISFDSKFVEESGIKKDGNIDRKLLQTLTKNSINKLIERENMGANTYWSGAIHYNTDNIHVHVAMVQTEKPRTKYKLKMRSIKSAKGEIGKVLLNDKETLKDINKYIREDLSKTSNKTFELKMNSELRKIISELPKDKKLWKYNNNVLSKNRKDIDKYIDKYLLKNNNKYNELCKLLDKQDKIYESAYGKKGQFKSNKINELKSRLGNNFLREIKEVDKKEKDSIYKKNQIKRNFKSKMQSLVQVKHKNNKPASKGVSNAINNFLNSGNKTIEEFKNEQIYKKLQREIAKEEEKNIEYDR